MARKMLDSTPPSRPSQEASMYGNNFLELLCQNGQIHVQGDPPRTTRNGPSCIVYSVNSRRGEVYDIEEDSRTTKRARLNTLDRLLDKSGQRNFHLDSPKLNLQQSKNAHDTYQFDLQYPKSSNNSIKHLPDTHLMLEDKSANLRPKKESKMTRGDLQLASTSDNSEICTSFLQQCLDSTRMMKNPATRGGPMPIPIKVNNFSNFSRYADTFKSTHHQGSNETRPTSSPASARLEKMKAGEDDKKPTAAGRTSEPECVVIDSSKSSHSLEGFGEQTALTASKANPVPPFAHNAYQLLPDEHSEAIGHGNTLIRGSHGKHCDRTLAENRAAKGKSVTDLCNEPLIGCSSSVCSPGASSDPTYLSRKHEETDESNDLSNNDDEAEGVTNEAPRAKRSRSSEVHNYSEKKQKRRDKINKKMRALKELIPNCNKMDKASMLDDAIGYIMALKLQLQIMSMGTSLCMPYMMLPAGAHHMPQFPAMGAGMGLTPNPALPCSLPQFPPPLLAPASLPGINDNRLQMFGLPNRVLPMSISHPPFIPMMLGKPSTQPIVAPLKATSSSLTTSMDSVADNSDHNAKVQCAVMQTSNQAPKLRPS